MYIEYCLALAISCMAVGVSWPVRSFMYLDMLNMYRDLIQWRAIINQDLTTFPQLRVLCATLLEWRWFIYLQQFNFLWGCYCFR